MASDERIPASDEGGDDPLPALGAPRLRDILQYRRAAIAVVGVYVGLDDAYVDAVLADRLDRYERDTWQTRERLKREHYDEYLSLLGREMMVRFAATAAESLASDPDLPGMRLPSLRHNDDLYAVARIHEIGEFLEIPDTDDNAEHHLTEAKRHLCAYYASCASLLVRGQLLPVIVAAAEELFRRGTLSAERARELVIAGETRPQR